MKHIALFIFFSFNIIFSYGQDAFDVPESILNPEHKSIVEKSLNDIKNAENLIKRAEAEEKKYSKLMNSSKRRKQKRAERKLVEAKQQRIKAARYYERAYSKLNEIYSEILENASFDFESDRQEANTLTEKADKALADEKQIITKYAGYNKRDLKKQKYNNLKSNLKTSKEEMEKAAINKLMAIKLWQAQTDKKIQAQLEAENNAWNTATQKNTINSYNNYLANYPMGKYADEAMKRIEQLKNKTRNLDLNNPNVGLVYKIQILADKKPWNETKIKRKTRYKGTYKIQQRYDDNYYKYSVGLFRKYNDAQTYKNSLRIKGAFIVCFYNGKQIHVVKAQDIEAKGN